jgi:hypothetical protein
MNGLSALQAEVFMEALGFVFVLYKSPSIAHALSLELMRKTEMDHGIHGAWFLKKSEKGHYISVKLMIDMFTLEMHKVQMCGSTMDVLFSIIDPNICFFFLL